MKKICLSAALVAMLFGSVFAVNKSQIVGSADQATSISKSVSTFTQDIDEEEVPDDTTTTTSTSTTSTSTTSTTSKTTKTTSSSTSSIVE